MKTFTLTAQQRRTQALPLSTDSSKHNFTLLSNINYPPPLGNFKYAFSGSPGRALSLESLACFTCYCLGRLTRVLMFQSAAGSKM